MDIVSKGIPNCMFLKFSGSGYLFYGYKGAYYNID